MQNSHYQCLLLLLKFQVGVLLSNLGQPGSHNVVQMNLESTINPLPHLSKYGDYKPVPSWSGQWLFLISIFQHMIYRLCFFKQIGNHLFLLKHTFLYKLPSTQTRKSSQYFLYFWRFPSTANFNMMDDDSYGEVLYHLFQNEKCLKTKINIAGNQKNIV